MNYMVIHEQLKAGGWRTIVPDIPRCGATGVKFETRKRSAERNIARYAAALTKAKKELPKNITTSVPLKRSVNRSFVHFVHIASLGDFKVAGTTSV